jgi:hypothetical protein
MSSDFGMIANRSFAPRGEVRPQPAIAIAASAIAAPIRFTTRLLSS